MRILSKNPAGQVVGLTGSKTIAVPCQRIDTEFVRIRNSSGRHTIWPSADSTTSTTLSSMLFLRYRWEDCISTAFDLQGGCPSNPALIMVSYHDGRQIAALVTKMHS